MTTRIRRIQLHDFRSYETLQLDFSSKLIAFSGANGAGKTNLLEALSLVSAGRGMRRAKTVELARQGGSGGWSVSIDVEGEYGELARLGVGVDDVQRDKKRVRIDGAPASGVGALLEYLNFLWLTPAQDRLFMDGAGERRRFLDRMILAHDLSHARSATAYEKAMRQRNKLLEKIEGADTALLSVLERQMAEAGVSMAAARREMVNRLMGGMADRKETLFPSADVSLDGDLEIALLDRPAAQVEEEFEAALKEGRRRDASIGRCLVGPHRSDMIVSHREKQQIARLCSTGEQKALLIGLVLANARSVTRSTLRSPLILLLDEVAAHLDEGRRSALYDLLEEYGLQTFMTGTDAHLFEAIKGRSDQYNVCDGNIVPLFV